MFSTVTTYTCNGCQCTATENKATSWTHLNNSPTDGKQNMDFCPSCTNKLKLTLFTNSHTTPVEPEPVTYDDTEELTESVNTNIEDTENDESSVDSMDERFIDFYQRLYTRVLYDIACDNYITESVKYLQYIPGKLSVDKRGVLDNTQVVLLINSKRVKLEKIKKNTATVITIYNGASVILSRKVSTFDSIKVLLHDIKNTAVNLLPTLPTQYTAGYLSKQITAIDKITDPDIPANELKSWITYAAELSSIDLS